jgi:predicted ABC-type ATPase
MHVKLASEVQDMSRDVYIIAGPNGAGKTTFAREFLTQYADCRNFVNADLIAQGVSPFSPESAAIRAGRLMLDEIQRYAQKGARFGFETTLSGRTYLPILRSLKHLGYRAHLFFLWLPDAELALSRVKGRVKQGGHDVPADVVRRRFDRSVSNFFRHYTALADSWILFDNSRQLPEIIASTQDGELRIMQEARYRNLTARYGAPK